MSIVITAHSVPTLGKRPCPCPNAEFCWCAGNCDCQPGCTCCRWDMFPGGN